MTTKNLYFQYFLAYKEHKIWNYANNVYKVFIFCIKKQIGLITLPAGCFCHTGLFKTLHCARIFDFIPLCLPFYFFILSQHPECFIKSPLPLKWSFHRIDVSIPEFFKYLYYFSFSHKKGGSNSGISEIESPSSIIFCCQQCVLDINHIQLFSYRLDSNFLTLLQTQYFQFRICRHT